MLAPGMTRIEAEAAVAAAPSDVWQTLLEHHRWAEWSTANVSRACLRAVDPLGGPADRVGALRRNEATVSVPLFGTRTLRWSEQVTDVAAPWTLELEAIDQPPIRQWRIRLWLVEQLTGGTRVRCRLTYRPSTLRLKLADALFLRRALAEQVQATLQGLAGAFAAPPAALPPSLRLEAEPETPAGGEEGAVDRTEAVAA